MVGWAFVTMSQYLQAFRWLSDWQSRSETDSDDLLHVALALRHFRRDDEARAASRRAVEMSFTSDMWRHHAWLAFDEACEANSARARQHLAQFPPQLDVNYYSFLRGLTLAMLRVQEASPGDSAALRDAKRMIAAAVRTIQWRRIPELASARLRAIRRIARDDGRLLTRVWSVAARLG
jgi:hypothetical protein